MSSVLNHLIFHLWLALCVIVALAAPAGCKRRATVEPDVYASPYVQPKVWAVVPLSNESGVSEADGARLADHLAQQLQQAERINVVPVNRVLEAMSAMNLAQVVTVGDAMALMNTLRADGLVVGTITAWDPYDPPKIGATVQLYTRPRPDRAMDPRLLTRAATGDALPSDQQQGQPIATAGGHFDAASGTVIRRLEAYAKGRTPPDSAAGQRRYLISMDLYSEFVSHELMRRLFATEWDRLHAQQHPRPVPRPTRTATVVRRR